MEWITQEYVEEQANKGEMEALQCSRLHHQQPQNATRGELVDVIESDAFHLSNNLCACCQRYDTSCSKCPLTTIGKGSARDRCCDGIYSIADVAGKAFFSNPSNENHLAFTKAESKVCDYIQGVIDKKKLAEEKPELRHGDYGIFRYESWKYGDECKTIFIQRDKDLTSTCSDGSFGCSTKEHNRYEIFGNIFDDLKALSQPLTEFEVKESCGYAYTLRVHNSDIHVDNMVQLEIKENDTANVLAFNFTPQEFSGFVTKCHRMEATLKKESKK